jgi:hypothetical protein
VAVYFIEVDDKNQKILKRYIENRS